MTRPTLLKQKNFSPAVFQDLMVTSEQSWDQMESQQHKDLFDFLTSLSKDDQEKIVIPYFLETFSQGIRRKPFLIFYCCLQDPSYLTALSNWVEKKTKKVIFFENLMDSLLNYMKSLSKQKKEDKKYFVFCLSLLGLFAQEFLRQNQKELYPLLTEMIAILYAHANQVKFYDLLNLLYLLGKSQMILEHSKELLEDFLKRYGASLLNASFKRYQEMQTNENVIASLALNLNFFFFENEFENALIFKSFRSFFYRQPDVCSLFLKDLSLNLNYESVKDHLFLKIFSYLLKSSFMIKQKKFTAYLIQPFESYLNHHFVFYFEKNFLCKLKYALEELEKFCEVEKGDFNLINRLSLSLLELSNEKVSLNFEPRSQGSHPINPSLVLFENGMKAS